VKPAKDAKAPTKAERERWTYFADIGCVCCRKYGYYTKGVQVHHLNLDGHAGQKRLGHDHTIPLCCWHHLGQTPMGMTSPRAATLFGPSLAKESKRFRDVFGSDQELLAETDRLIAEQKKRGVGTAA
jgi:hypothetical protein